MGRKTTARVTALMVAVNEELRALIARRNLSQRQLEAAAGVSQSLISKTIFKEESVLNLSQFEAICGVLGVSPSVVLESAERAVLVSDRPRPAARKKEAVEAELASLTDAQLAAQILARAEAATKAGYRLAAHPADKVITDDGNWTA